MPNEDEDSGSSWLSGGFKKLVEFAISALIVLAAAKLGLAPKPNDLKDPSNWPLLVAIIVLFGAYKCVWPPLWRAAQRWQVRRAKPDKIRILLAQLHGNDKDGSLRETVSESIVAQLGDAVDVILWPEALRVGDGNQTTANIKAGATAQRWLNDKSCDLLIWGRIKSDKTVALRFSPREGPASESRSYGLTADTLDLPPKFGSDLGAALAARIVVEAARAVDRRGQYLVGLMRTSAQRIEPILSNLNPNFNADTRGSLFLSYALVKQTIDEQAGSPADLQAAIDAYAAALAQWTRTESPLSWAGVQNNLGTALARLGLYKGGSGTFEKAVTAYREALKEYKREQMPLEWATIQNNLGRALTRLGEREKRTEYLTEAITTFREALKEITRERSPSQWATLQNNLAAALVRIGEREDDIGRLNEAATAFRSVLKERRRELVPLQWARAQNNLGVALLRIGERESGTVKLREAAAAFRKALQEWTREQVPLEYATAQSNLGKALTRLGERESDPTRLEEAIAAFRDAVGIFEARRAADDRAETKHYLECAEKLLSEQRANTKH
jgi:tetratricopeptide (TPR) repeat protein